MAMLFEIRSRITRLLASALGVDEDDITPHATLLGDLGAESIDLLDIVFRLEREFGIKIGRGELFIEPLFEADAHYLEDGWLTEVGLVSLRALMPFADLTCLDYGRRLANVKDLFTVDLLVRYVSWKLQRAETAIGT